MKQIYRQSWRCACKWKKISQNLLLQVAEGLGTDVTTPTGGVEPSSFAAAGDRLPVHLNSSFSTACPGNPQDTPESSNDPLEDFARMERDTTAEKKEAERLEFETWLGSRNFWICRGVKYRRVQVVRLK